MIKVNQRGQKVTGIETLKVILLACKYFNFFMLGENFSRRQFEFFALLLIFPRKQDLTHHANCLLRRQFAWSVRSYFLGRLRKTIISLSSAEPAHSVVSVNLNSCFFFHPKVYENMCRGCSLETPRCGASNEYPQHMFLWRNKKNIYLIPTLI